MEYAEELDHCKNFGDIFELVKKTAEKSLGQRRAGLMLYLANLPQYIGAFHGLGTNGIVMNRSALDAVTRSARSIRDVNAYVYSILLHEYIHALGYVDEPTVRRLVYQVSRETLGPDHPATDIALKGPATYFPGIVQPNEMRPERIVEIVSDFERSTQSYIK